MEKNSNKKIMRAVVFIAKGDLFSGSYSFTCT